MHLRGVTLLQSVDGLGKLFAETLVFDVLDWIQVTFEGENKSLRLWEPVKSLAFTSNERLFGILVSGDNEMAKKTDLIDINILRL